MPQQEYEIVTGIIVVTFILLLAGFFITALVAFNNRRKKKHIEEKQIMQSNFKEEILRTQLEIQEHTLKNISQEIHDNIGQVLSLAKLNLGTINQNNTEKHAQKIEDSKNLVGKAIQDLRDLSKSLNTDYVMYMGLVRSVEYELEMIKKMGVLDTHFEIIGSPVKFDNQKELILFRIVQETLNNIIKHSQASQINVLLTCSDSNLEIMIKDNGQGFDQTLTNSSDQVPAGLGLRNMRNRAHLINADFSLTSHPGEGTIIFLSVPLKTSNYE